MENQLKPSVGLYNWRDFLYYSLLFLSYSINLANFVFSNKLFLVIFRMIIDVMITWLHAYMLWFDFVYNFICWDL